MKKEAQIKLINNILIVDKKCHVRIAVWFPTVKELKHLLSMKHISLEANSNKANNTIFSIWHEHTDGLGFSAVEVVFYCNEPEAKFMRMYIKEKGGDKNC